MNTIEEASRSKLDSEWPANTAYYRNVFIANSSTPRQIKETPEHLTYIRLAKSYLELLSMGTISCSGDYTFSKLIQNHPLMAESTKDPSRIGTGRQLSILRPNNLLSYHLLGAFHTVLCLVPKMMKLELVECITNLIRQDKNSNLTSALLPTLKECVRFLAFSKAMRNSSERLNCANSVGNSSHGLEGRISSIYKSFQSKVTAE